MSNDSLRQLEQLVDDNLSTLQDQAKAIGSLPGLVDWFNVNLVLREALDVCSFDICNAVAWLFDEPVEENNETLTV